MQMDKTGTIGLELVMVATGTLSPIMDMFKIFVFTKELKYNVTFVVPSTSPDFLPDTPSGVSGGSKLTKITDGAFRFDGTGDYLSLADNDDFDLGIW